MIKNDVKIRWNYMGCMENPQIQNPETEPEPELE